MKNKTKKSRKIDFINYSVVGNKSKLSKVNTNPTFNNKKVRIKVIKKGK